MKGHYGRNSATIKTQNSTFFQDGPFYTLAPAFESGVFPRHHSRGEACFSQAALLETI
jgi:hypothetical protein